MINVGVDARGYLFADACSNGNGDSTDPDPVSVPAPGSNTQETVTLREIGSCDEAGEAFAAYLSGFESYESTVVAGDDRYYFASNNWEAAGFTRIDDPHVEPFDGLAILADIGPSQSVHVMGRHFDARLQVVARRGQEPDHIPVDDAIDILLALTES